jgi:hypothetical protein
MWSNMFVSKDKVNSQKRMPQQILLMTISPWMSESGDERVLSPRLGVAERRRRTCFPLSSAGETGSDRNICGPNPASSVDLGHAVEALRIGTHQIRDRGGSAG